tara:strand:+ start:41787 stop:41951 length:165 start_codon:yes stop_codon:yes gene_type:complete
VKQYYCDIDIAHLIVYNDELAQNLTQNPAEVIPLVCRAVLLDLAQANSSSLKQP